MSELRKLDLRMQSIDRQYGILKEKEAKAFDDCVSLLEHGDMSRMLKFISILPKGSTAKREYIKRSREAVNNMPETTQREKTIKKCFVEHLERFVSQRSI